MFPEISGAPALPYNRRRQRLAGLAVPNDSRLALVGDADCCNLMWADIRPLQGALSRRSLSPPDLDCILLDPTRLGVRAVDRRRFHGDPPACVIVERGSCAGGALVEGEDVSHSGIIMSNSTLGVLVGAGG